MKIHHHEINNIKYEEITVDEIHGTKCERCGKALSHTFFVWRDGAFVCAECIDDLINTPLVGVFARGNIYD